MTLWKESTNILPADGDLVWVRRFPGIEHPKQAIFAFGGGTSSTFAVTVYAPTSATPTILTIPAYLIHSWRPRSISPPPPGACAAQEAAGDPTGIAVPAFLGQLYHDTVADAYYRSTGETSTDWAAIGGICPPPYGDCTMLEAAGDPTGLMAPNFTGQLYHDDTNDVYYRSVGQTSSDWLLIGGTQQIITIPPGLGSQVGLSQPADIPGLISLTVTAATTDTGYLFQTLLTATSISFPNLTTVDPANAHYIGINISYNDSLTSISLPNLTTIPASLNLQANPALTSLDLTSLTTAGPLTFSGTNLTALALPALVTCGNIYADFITALADVLLPVWIPTGGNNVSFRYCALTAASVEIILRQCALAGVMSMTIQLDGGDNAGLASLSPQGQADYAALIAAPNYIDINP
jgi:hypothetical protein